MSNHKIVFLGGGMMAEAIMGGILKAALFKSEDITVVEIVEERRAYLNKKYAVATADKAQKAVPGADVLILAVKPQMLGSALGGGMVAAVEEKTLVISIVAGVSLKQLQEFFGGQQPLLRAMPNTPLAVGAGMTALSPGQNVSREGIELAMKIFSSCGEALELPESQLDVVTGLSGSGPGYLFVIIDALADAGVMAGLPRNIAIKLAAQTVFGSGKMALESGLHPAQLRDQVTSPGGTTIAGIAAMEKSGVRAGMIEAVLASMEKSRSFSQDDK